MEPLSAKNLNNQIVSMRKDVKRAIVHQIHHLTTAAKRLRSKKGSDEQKKKNASKADNMGSEIAILKFLKPDDVSMFALTNYEESVIKSFICKQIIAPETKTIAKLCLRKNLRSVVDQFVASRSEEIELLNTLLQERYIQKEKKESKQSKNINEEVESSNEQTSDTDESVPGLVALSDSDLDAMSENNNLLNSNKKNHPEKRKHVDIGKMTQANDQSAKRKKTSNLGRKKSISNESIPEKILDKEDPNSVIADLGISEDSTRPFERKNVDPFFITRDNSEYRTYCNINDNLKKEIEKNPADKRNIREFQKDVRRDFTDRRENKRDNSLKKNSRPSLDNKRTITYLGGKNKNRNIKKEWKNSGKYSREDSSTDIKSVKLHPSWEAKKKLSIAPTSFQGKKITFDD